MQGQLTSASVQIPSIGLIMNNLGAERWDWAG